MQGINRIKDEGRLGKQERPFGTEVAAINLLISPQNPRPTRPVGQISQRRNPPHCPRRRNTLRGWASIGGAAVKRLTRTAGYQLSLRTDGSGEQQHLKHQLAIWQQFMARQARNWSMPRMLS